MTSVTKTSGKTFWVDGRFNKGFIKSYNEESNEGYLLKVDAQYP